MLLLALPLLLIPDLLIKAWIGAGYRRQLFGDGDPRRRAARAPADLRPDAVPDRARPAASDRDRLDRVTVGEPRRCRSSSPGPGASGASRSRRSSPTSSMLGWVVPRIVAPAAAHVDAATLVRAILRPRRCPALGVARSWSSSGIARWWHPRHAARALCRSGALGLGLAAAAIWRFGLAPGERAQFGREFWRRSPPASPCADDLGRARRGSGRAPRSRTAARARPSRAHAPRAARPPRARRALRSSSSRTTASTKARASGTRSPAPVSRRFEVTS